MTITRDQLQELRDSAWRDSKAPGVSPSLARTLSKLGTSADAVDAIMARERVTMVHNEGTCPEHQPEKEEKETSQ